MSAADLRRAAEVLRERAEAAGPDFDRGVAKLGRRTQKGQYAQTMRPGVGLALADWLDREAAIHDMSDAMGDLLKAAAKGLDLGELRVQFKEDESGYAMSTMPQAVAVARLILGDDA